MSVPASQMWTVASYVLKQKLARKETVPVRPDAGAFIPVQPGVRGVRQNPSIRRTF